VENLGEGAISIYRDEKSYEKLTKAELIKAIKNLEANNDQLEEQLEHLAMQTERQSRSIYEYEQREKKREFSKQFPHINPWIDGYK
jgi:peptidoglycan hydrolase CwlO-like protein